MRHHPRLSTPRYTHPGLPFGMRHVCIVTLSAMGGHGSSSTHHRHRHACSLLSRTHFGAGRNTLCTHNEAQQH